MPRPYYIPLLLLHDFDKSGFSIAGTLQRDTRRYEFQNGITTIDLGLNTKDVTAMGLESEYQHHPKGDKAALIANLRENRRNRGKRLNSCSGHLTGCGPPVGLS